MDILCPGQHGRLVFWEPAVPELPGMHPKLLPVKIANLQNPIPSQQGVSMVPPPWLNCRCPLLSIMDVIGDSVISLYLGHMGELSVFLILN